MSLEDPYSIAYLYSTFFFLSLFFILGLLHCATYVASKRFLKFFSIYVTIFLLWYLSTEKGCSFFDGCFLDREMIAWTAVGTTSLILVAKILSNILNRETSVINRQSPIDELPKRERFLFIKILVILVASVWFLVDW
jgi:hypothetical protein